MWFGKRKTTFGLLQRQFELMCILGTIIWTSIDAYTYRGYYMPTCGYEFYLQVFNWMCEWVRYWVEHNKTKFVSTNRHVIFCLLHKHTNDDHWPFSEDFWPLSEDLRRFSKIVLKARRTLPNIFRKLPKTTWEETKMFRSYINEFKCS